MRPAGARRPGIGLTELATGTAATARAQSSRLPLEPPQSRRLAIKTNPDETQIVSHGVSSRGYTPERRSGRPPVSPHRACAVCAQARSALLPWRRALAAALSPPFFESRSCSRAKRSAAGTLLLLWASTASASSRKLSSSLSAIEPETPASGWRTTRVRRASIPASVTAAIVAIDTPYAIHRVTPGPPAMGWPFHYRPIRKTRAAEAAQPSIEPPSGRTLCLRFTPPSADQVSGRDYQAAHSILVPCCPSRGCSYPPSPGHSAVSVTTPSAGGRVSLWSLRGW
jgi:hypothetical protein